MVAGHLKEEGFNLLFFMYEDYICLIRPEAFEVQSISGSHEIFSIHPIQKGFGSTMANALRRVLLSSIRGVKITSVQIDGVSNEFSVINGVQEDVMSICMSLRKVILKMDDVSSCEGRISITGPKVVRASDIIIPKFVEILNPDLELFTISSNVKIDAKIQISSGIGSIIYDAADLANNKSDIGVIHLNCAFSPVRNVSFDVVNTRFGSATDYDKIILDVKTDGSISPSKAVSFASALIRDFFKKFVTFEEELIQKKKEDVESNDSYDHRLLRSTNTLELSVRSSNCLHNMGIERIGDLVVKTEAELLAYQNFGNKSLNEVKSQLDSLGLSLGMKIQWPIGNMDEILSTAYDEDDDISSDQ